VKATFRVIYRLVGFVLLFFLLGTLFVYIETVAIEDNIESFVDESGILQNKYEKSLIPIIASSIISYIVIFHIPWFKKNEN
jgi:succinate dehydrogenase/fumarate reductase cytochrome b subunit|tara:strand:- start:1505 stop:1747 length:243 start_codon:yes stop_codon:yes gene_type:complete